MRGPVPALVASHVSLRSPEASTLAAGTSGSQDPGLVAHALDFTI